MPQAPTGKLLRHVRQLLAAHDSHMSSDQELLRRFAAGREEAAFAALVQRYGPLVWQLISSAMADGRCSTLSEGGMMVGSGTVTSASGYGAGASRRVFTSKVAVGRALW